MDERLPRSAPDALRYEPGVYVQQTAHGQGSPFVRGMTGQQVVHIFDGVRMNNGIYRQGPNQYFFTVDSQSVDHIDVLRGSASTRYGSDALGGAILAYPIEPLIDPTNDGLQLEPSVFGRFASADSELGGRAQVGASLSKRTGMLVGGGYRRARRLESGGLVSNPGQTTPMIPRFEDDGRTQLGTGFKEGTFDARIVHQFTKKLRVVGALYGYRQLDAPRTDQCPPPEAPSSECLWIDKQFRTLSYVSLRGNAGTAFRDLNLTLSYQNYHESRHRDRPRSFVEHRWNDDVHSLGLTFRAATLDFPLGTQGSWKLRYGAELIRDGVNSDASSTFTDIDTTLVRSRGQYIDGSSYVTTGVFVEADFEPLSWLTLRAGSRLSGIAIRSAGDAVSETQAVNREFAAAVARGGVEVRPLDELSLHLNIDQGFRAPNLDDLTSRVQAGPGFQFENPDLVPERTITYELGAQSDLGWIRVEAWTFATSLSDAIIRSVRDATDCPPDTASCEASRSRFQLINADDTSYILGAEGGLTFYLPEHVTARATASYAWGEGPNTGSTAINAAESVPLSRIPPFNGTLETRWRLPKLGLYFSGALRWALAQRRLAPSDLSDPRIPIGGTPGYAVFDLRAGYKLEERFRLTLIFENVFDAAYRIHGSSVNSAGRGLLLASQISW